MHIDEDDLKFKKKTSYLIYLPSTVPLNGSKTNAVLTQAFPISDAKAHWPRH